MRPYASWRPTLAVLALALLPGPGITQESWVGKTILLKKSGIKIGRTDDNGRQVYLATLDAPNYKVRGDQGGWIKVATSHGIEGWFDKADAVLLEDAVAYFTAALQGNPNDAATLFRRGLAWRLKGELDIAIRDYDEVLRLDPQAGVYNARGNAWRYKKEYDRAIADYNEAIRLDPKDVTAYNNRGNTWRDKKEYGKAIADYNEGIRLDPSNRAGWNQKAWLLATCPDERYRDGNKAIAAATKALGLDKNNAGVMDTLAAAFAEAGDFAEAVHWQERALADPAWRDNEEMQGRLQLYRQQRPYRQGMTLPKPPAKR
jgi:tetratricopeptide (TPR) repeat protein